LPSALVRRGSYKWWTFFAIAIGLWVMVMDQGSLVVALPTIASHFQTDIPTVQWVVVGYGLAISALLLPMGRMADLIGRKRVYITGSLVFVAGAALAGTSTTIYTLILFKILQGCGAAMTQGTGMAIITSTFPGSERGKALGSIITVVGVGAIAGPAIGGLLVSYLGWRSIFFVGIAIGLVGTVTCLRVLEDRRPAQRDQGGQRASFDWLGAAVSTGALVVFLVTVTSGHKYGWASPLILSGLLGCAVLVWAFIWWERRAAAPMLDLGLFQRRAFSLGVSAGFITFLGTSSVIFLLPFYLQRVLGFSPAEAGLIIVPGALSFAVAGPISGRLSDRYGWRKLQVTGLVLCAMALFILSRLTESSSLAHVIPALVLQGCGLSMFNTSNSSSVLGAVEQEKYGVVSSLIQLARNAATVTSIAVAATIVIATMASMGYAPSLEAVTGSSGAGVFSAFTSGVRIAFLVSGCLLVAATVVSIIKSGQVKEVAVQQPGQPQVEGTPPD